MELNGYDNTSPDKEELLPVKRKRIESSKTYGKRKRKKLQGVLQFIDDAAYEVDENESTDGIEGTLNIICTVAPH